VAELENRGVRLIHDTGELPEGTEGRRVTAVIRSHGAPPRVFEELRAKNVEILDCTCPHVGKIQEIIKKSLTFDRKIIIIGDETHPEVIGLNGSAGNAALIISDAASALALDDGGLAGGWDVVAQSTFIRERFEEITRILSQKCADLNIHDTICPATAARQREAAELAAWADIMIVLGDAGSSNTTKLVEICRRRCARTYLFNTADGLESVFEPGKPPGNIRIGITAGASTPPDIIKEAIRKMSELEDRATDIVNTGSEQAQAEPQKLESQLESELNLNEQIQPAPEQQAQVDWEQPEQHEPEPEQQTPVQSEPEQQAQAPAQPKSFEDMLNESFVALHTGDVVTGTVISINNGEVSVNLGFKSDGIITKGEFAEDPNVDPANVVKPGDKIDVFVVRVNDGDGNVLLSKKKLDSQKGYKELEEAFENKTPIKGKISDIVKGGAIAHVNGYRVFIPLSQLSNRFVADVESMRGKTYNFEVLEFDKAKRRIVAGRRSLAAVEEKENKERMFASLEIGQKVEGVVSRIANFGAFVDLGGVDGLIHISELSWGRAKHVKDVVSEGDKVTCTVIALDPEKDKISLTLKDAEKDPWHNVEQRYPIGSIVQGKVVRMTSFGAFVELETGLDGLVHISQIADKHVVKPSDELRTGEIINVKVINIDRTNGRISLSKREADSILAGPEEYADEADEFAEQAPAETAEEAAEVFEDQAGQAAEEAVAEAEAAAPPVEEAVEETVEETVKENVEETVNETVEETVVETVNETVAEPVKESIEEASETVAEAARETAAPVEDVWAEADGQDE